MVFVSVLEPVYALSLSEEVPLGYPQKRKNKICPQQTKTTTLNSKKNNV